MNVTILKGYTAHNENVAISGSDVILRSYENTFYNEKIMTLFYKNILGKLRLNH